MGRRAVAAGGLECQVVALGSSGLGRQLLLALQFLGHDVLDGCRPGLLCSGRRSHHLKRLLGDSLELIVNPYFASGPPHLQVQHSISAVSTSCLLWAPCSTARVRRKRLSLIGSRPADKVAHALRCPEALHKNQRNGAVASMVGPRSPKIETSIRRAYPCMAFHVAWPQTPVLVAHSTFGLARHHAGCTAPCWQSIFQRDRSRCFRHETSQGTHLAPDGGWR